MFVRSNRDGVKSPKSPAARFALAAIGCVAFLVGGDALADGPHSLRVPQSKVESPVIASDAPAPDLFGALAQVDSEATKRGEPITPAPYKPRSIDRALAGTNTRRATGERLNAPEVDEIGAFIAQNEDPFQDDAAETPRPEATDVNPSTLKEAETLPAEPARGPSGRIDYSSKPIADLGASIALPTGIMPENAAKAHYADDRKYAHEYAPPASGIGYFWVAAATKHNPLYFEEINAERYGYNFGCLQPAVSAAHFFATIPALPYIAAAHPPCEEIYTLGVYRPGSCYVPNRCNWPTLSWSGAVSTGVTATGLVFLLP